MKKIIFTLLIAFLLFSCEKYPEPGSKTLEMFYFHVIGNSQSAESGNYLPMEIGCQIDLGTIIPKDNKQFRLELQITSGDGSLDEEIVLADANGRMATKWRLGNDKNNQVVACQIFDSEDKLYSEFNIGATAFFLDQWNTITTGFLTKIRDMVVDTMNKRSLMISFRDLYWKDGDESKFYEWQILNRTIHSNFKDIEINSKGEVFGGDWDGNLYKSKDWGQSWSFICKPIPDYKYNFDLSISADDYIWVSKWEQGVYCSKDEGVTWQKDTIGIPGNQQLGRVYLFNDTSHLAMGLNILQTFDDGITWNPINTPQYPLNLFVTGKNEIIVQTQGGFTLYKSTDSGKTYKNILSPNSNYVTTSHHCYKKFENHYYVLAPRTGIWKTKDFEEFEKLITLNIQKNLFIDHTGTIYAAAFLDEDPTMVLANSE